MLKPQEGSRSTNGSGGNGSGGAGAAATVRKLADAVWSELQWRGVLPTPHNFSLWFTYRAETDPRLTKRMAELLAPGRPLASEVLDALYEEYLGCYSDAQPLTEDAAQIEDAVRNLIDHVAGSQAAVEGYGATLAHWKLTLGGGCTQDALLLAVTALATETARAAERNRLLQQQLATSAARISRLRQSLTAVRQEATTDALTGIANRKAFEARLRRLMRQARSETAAISLLLIDIDHFKAFNDSYGHRTGDLVLRLVARVLADNVKGRDCAARYGGEEFAVILAGTELAPAMVVARQISCSLSSIRLIDDGDAGQCRITVSIGAAQYRPGETGADLTERADQALYEAKRLGRNQVCAASASSEAQA